MMTSLVPSGFFFCGYLIDYVNFIVSVVVFAIELFFLNMILLCSVFTFCLFMGMLNQIQVHFIPDNGTIVYYPVISIACMLTSMTLLFLLITVISFSALRPWCHK